MFEVFLVFRKRNPRFFSIESVFEWVGSALTGMAKLRSISLPRYGVSVRNLVYLFRRRLAYPRAIFHVTGDAHYVVISLPRKRTVLTIHDCGFLDQQGALKRWLLKYLLLDLPVWYTKYITTISEKTKQEIIKSTGCNASKIRVIPNPVSPNVHYTASVFNSACPVLLFIGLTPNKNLERACLAIKGLTCVMRVIGNLSDEQREANQIKYEYVFGLSDKEMANEYVAADIVYFPSLYEGFGLPVIEGFKAGRAVLTSEVSPIKEIALDGAFLVDPLNVNSIREGLLQIIDNHSLRELRIKRGLELARQYAPEFIASKYNDVYEEVFLRVCND
jgi:glycosyltransferase involved in cell wall biosynthesis